VFNQDENLQLAINKRMVRIEEINGILAREKPSGGLMQALIEERSLLEEVVAELRADRKRLQLQNADSSFRWEDIDQRILSHKTNEIAEEMHKRAAAVQRRIAHETAQSGNSAGYLPRWIDFHEQLANEWAEKVYTAHCEAWIAQNRRISPAFIRAVRDLAVAQTLAARKSSVQFEIGLRAVRIGDSGNPQNSAIIGTWIRRMDRLAARWNSKLEA
jgi:hypothetical protein